MLNIAPLSLKLYGNPTTFVKVALVTAALICFFHLSLAAQSQAPAALAGTYAPSVNDGVDVFSGKLQNMMPLVDVKGRGEAKVGLYFPLRNLDWVANKWLTTDPGSPPGSYIDHYQAKLAPTNYYGVESSVSLMSLTRGGYGLVGKIKAITTRLGNLSWSPVVVTTIEFVSNDGTVMELRDVGTDGQPLDAVARGCYSYQISPPPIPAACSRGRVFRSTKGENATFVADSDIYDYLNYDLLGNPIPSGSAPSGTLFFNNGTRVTFGTALIDIDGYNVKLSRIKDRNGNYIDLEYSTDAFPRLTKIVDSLKREVTIAYGDSSQASFYDSIQYRGFGGAQREIRINYTDVENSMLPGHSLTPIFPGVRNICGYPNPPQCPGPNYGIGTAATSQRVVSSITLPNNTEYRFYYNEYLEVARVKNPLGSYVDYGYSGAIVGGDADGYYYLSSTSSQSINRRVASVRSYDESGILVNQKNFAQPIQFVMATQTRLDNVVVDVADGSGNTLGKSKHYFYGYPEEHGRTWRAGKEYKSEILDAVSGAVLRQIETTWAQRAPFQWCNGILAYYACDETNWPGSSPPVDPRLTETKTTLETGQVTKKTFSYDQYNNLTDTYEYDYGSGQAGSFLRRGHTDYVTDSNYTNYTGAHLKGLPLQSWTSSDVNGNNKTALTQIEYDNYSVNELFPRSNVSGHDTTNFGTANTRRGNATKATSFSDAQNQTGAVATQTQYDILGNVVKTIDPKGFVSTVDYSDRFGSPDAEARSNMAPGQLTGLSTFAFATSATNPAGFTGYTQFDYFSGSVVDGEDLNGNVSTTFYNDVLDRPTQVIRANNRPNLRSQTTTAYDDIGRKVTVTSDLYSFNDNLSKGESFYDSLGRTTETRSYETGGYTVTAKPQFDALGRVIQSSNPYRPYMSEQPVWTTTTYDNLGRIVKVKTPDNAEATTSFYGNITTATDQAGKKRRSVINAIGQVTRVDEPNTANDLGEIATPTQATYYTYNTNGSLVKVAQGQQNRYFLYDSLGRLLRVRQPEQGTNSSLTLSDPVTGNSLWSTGSAYDANGNVLSTLDAKGVLITQTYDNVNRSLTRTYSDGTPSVTYEYENPNITNIKGILTKVSSSVSTTEYVAFDILGRVTAHKQTTDGNAYTTGYTYNLSGGLIEETYPSGRVVKNTLDNDGRLANVATKAIGQNDFHLSASSFSYAASGVVTSMRLGNGRWESAQFNSRLQITQIGLGSSQGTTNLWKNNYEYGEIDATGNLDTSKNNGNIARQTTNFGGLNQPFVQSFRYDSLSRLTEAKEMSGTTQTWLQNFGYDRYGNRTGFNQQKIGEAQITQTPTVDPATNRFVTGQGFVYDFNGNLITDNQGRQFTFNGDNKQTQVRDAATNTVGLYFYDGSGARVKKISASETTIFVYNAGGKLVAEYSTQTAAIATVSYLTNDTLGSPRVITDNSGAVTSRRDFMPFGEELYAGTANRTVPNKYSTTGSDNVRKRFTGYEKDTETGLDFAEARYYDNRYGRFTAVDPLLASGHSADPQSFNRYAYVTNNPIALTDPSGELPEDLMYGWFGGGSLIGIGIPNMSTFMEVPNLLVGRWNQLTKEQRDLFTGYYNNNYGTPIEISTSLFSVDPDGRITGGDITISGGAPALPASIFWTISAGLANAGTPSGRFLSQDQLTTYIGVTSMWIYTKTIDLIATVDEIVKDTEKDGFRLRGTFKPGGGESIRDGGKWFKLAGFSKGNGKYTESYRERDDGGAPNGQFTMTKDFKGFDSDVDYHGTNSPLHLFHENSDIRQNNISGLLFKRDHMHLQHHIERYGPVPITIGNR